MKKKIFSWAKSFSYENKWDRLAMTDKGTFVIGYVALHDEAYHSQVFNTVPGEPAVFSSVHNSLEEAKQFIDKELKRQGF